MYYIGLDLGKRQDFTAIAVVEKSSAVESRFEHVPWMQTSYPVESMLEVRYLERMALGTPYTDVVDRVVRLVQDSGLRKWRRRLVVDATGVGNPVVDMLQKARPGCEILPVISTGGDAPRFDGRVWHVPKLDLLAELQRVVERKEIRIAKQLSETETLVREMLDVQARFGARGRTRLGAEGAGQHDDLVIAVALACWAAKKVGTQIPPGVRLFW